MRASRALAGAIQATLDRYGQEPAARSPASADWLDHVYGHVAWGVAPAESVDLQALLSLRAAVDQSHWAVRSAAMGGFASSLTLSRGSLEGSAWCRYLADPSISLSERCRRQVNELLNALHEQAHASYDYGDTAEAEALRSRQRDILDAAHERPAWGVRVYPSDDRRGGPNWRVVPRIGARRPSVMTLIDQLLETPDGRSFGSRVYRVASSVAHSVPHGFQMAGVVVAAEDGWSHLLKDEPWSDSRMAIMLVPSVAGTYNAATVLCNRLGWNSNAITRAARKTIGVFLETGSPGGATDLSI